jgi:sec-independent protein translocase protein TatB
MLSVPHLIIIFVVALVVLGPEKLPEVARVLGKIMSEFRKVSTDFRTTLEDEMREIDRHLREKERLAKEAAAAAPAPTIVPALPAAPATESPAAGQPGVIAEPEDSENTVATRPESAGEPASESAADSAPAAPPSIPDPDARHINPVATPALVAEPAPASEANAPETPSERAMTES